MPTRPAATTFSASPSLNRKPRRVDVDEEANESRSVHICSTLRPAGDRLTMPDEPGHEVGNLLGRQRPPRRVLSPVGLAEVRSPGNHRGPQRLVAYQREIRRIHDRAHCRPSLTLRPMAPCTGTGKDSRTPFFRSRALAGSLVGWQRQAGHGLGPGPVGEHSRDECVDLRIRQIAPGGSAERRHRGARNSFADDRAEPIGGYEGEVDGVVQRPGGAESSVLTVTAGAVALVDHVERHHLRGQDLAIGHHRPSGQGVTGGGAETDDDRNGGRGSTCATLHRSISRRPRTPEALTPARAASGHVCIVATGCARDTTYPAASPNASWETTNQVQSTRAFRIGLMTPSTAQRPPVHKSGATRPPQSTCRPGSIGKITA